MSDRRGPIWYADHAWQGTVRIQENVRVAEATYRLGFRCAEIARRILPGQFLMVRLPETGDPLLGRPLALHDTLVEPEQLPVGLQVLYLVVGKMTRRLAMLSPGSLLEVLGPLGNGFPVEPTGHLVMVAGGIGLAPLMALARESLGHRSYGDPPRQAPRAARVTLCYGARTAGYLADLQDFKQLGVEVRISTEDGSAGHRGLVTELIEPVVAGSTGPCRLVACGPEPMLEAAARVAQRLGIPCQVSLERPMACGIGVCFGCVARVRDGSGGWDYRRTCVEGPVFDAQQVEF